MPGETIKAHSRNIFAGGKGLNQSIAMARAGVEVYHAGCVGDERALLVRTLQVENIDTEHILSVCGDSGHTVIQVEKSGQNSIIFYAGANHKLTKCHIEKVINQFSRDDFIILQNEINHIGYIMEQAYIAGMKIVFNPSPYVDEIKNLPLRTVSYFVVNEIEGKKLFNAKTIEEIIPNALLLYPKSSFLVTLGEKGSMYYDNGTVYLQAAYKTDNVDTTAAGDTFLGYFIHGLTNGLSIKQTLDNAAVASAIAVSRHGAALSIPKMKELSAGVEMSELPGYKNP